MGICFSFFFFGDELLGHSNFSQQMEPPSITTLLLERKNKGAAHTARGGCVKDGGHGVRDCPRAPSATRASDDRTVIETYPALEHVCGAGRGAAQKASGAA